MKKEEVKETKKEKVKYYDDGSTVVDMSGLNDTKKPYMRNNNQYGRVRSTEAEKLKTFFAAMKMMIVPCLIALAIIGLLYLILMFLAGNFS